MEKYSVLMSLYIKENPEYLKSAIDSMLNQTVQADEIVIVEDGLLTDELYAVLNEYEEKYPNLFTRVKNETNLGLGKALNRGLEYCKNELVARMDTDDIAKPDRCERQLKLFEADSDLSIASGAIAEFILSPSEVVSYRVLPETDAALKEYMKKRCPLNHVAVMFKKDAVEKAGNYQDWHYNEDYYLWLRMYLSGAKFANDKNVLVDVRVGKDMYQRRGGWKYFKSERALQKYMRKNKIIGWFTYLSNVFKRFVVQVLLPNKLRGWVYKKFARKGNKYDQKI